MAADLDAYERIFLRPEVGRWLAPPPLPPLSRDDAAERLEKDMRNWGQLGYGLWACVDSASGQLVGRVGLQPTTIEAIPEVELAWTIDPERHGEGLAGEAAREGVRFARELELREVVAVTLPGNYASRSVAEKLGMGLEGKISHWGLTHVIYRLDVA